MLDPEIIRQVQELKRNGRSVSEISRQLGISRPTVRKYLKAEVSSVSEGDASGGEEPEKQINPSLPLRRISCVDITSEKVKKAREEAELLTLEVQKAKALNQLEGLTRAKRKAEAEKEEAQYRKAWTDTWIDLGLRYFSFGCPIPLSQEVKLKKAIRDLLDTLPEDEDAAVVDLLLTDLIDGLRDEYNKKYIYPAWKSELIESAIKGLDLFILCDPEREQEVRGIVRRSLEQTFVGDEDPEEYFAWAETVKNELIGD